MKFEVFGTSPFTESFVEVEDGEVGEVRDSCYGFESVETGVVTVGSGEVGVE